jgi:YesN/AraC family two-component response regulator
LKSGQEELEKFLSEIGDLYKNSTDEELAKYLDEAKVRAKK